MTRRVEWPALLAERERAEWCAWFEQYGVSPRTVATPGWVEADDDARKFTYLALILDADGRPKVRGLNAITTRRTVQLVDAPAPFPWRP